MTGGPKTPPAPPGRGPGLPELTELGWLLVLPPSPPHEGDALQMPLRATEEEYGRV
jgi:hypothetical protein